MTELGKIHIYYGDGKGKTTAAVGLTVRCAGTGGRVLFIQWMKRDTSSERVILSRLPEVILLPGYPEMKFTFSMTEAEKQAAAVFYQQQWQEMMHIVQEQSIQMLVLDELCSCLNADFLSLQHVLSFLDTRPEEMEVVITGRTPHNALLKRADYATELQKKAHPFDTGLPARLGIEY